MSENGPTFTKATYDKKRIGRIARSPEREKRDLEDRMREAAKRQKFSKLVTRVGLGAALFPDIIKIQEPFKRRI